jgi:hypothetical protein
MTEAAATAAPAETTAAPAAAPAADPPATTQAPAASWVDATTETTPATAEAQAGDAPKDGAQAADAGDQAAEKADTEDKPAERAAPEAYEFKAPEGVALDKELTAEFEGLARELSMPQDEAQALVERMAPKIQARMQAAQVEMLATARAEWAAAVEADPEIGGQARGAALASAAKALKEFGTEPLRALLKDSGIEAHPEVIRFFSRAGKSLSEESFMGGRAPAKQSTAQAIYTASQMNP